MARHRFRLGRPGSRRLGRLWRLARVQGAARTIPTAIWGPLVAALLVFVIGLVAYGFDRVWLFPSLGPTAFLLGEMPEHKSAHEYNTVVGHFTAIGCGYLAVWITGAYHDPAILAGSSGIYQSRVWAAGLAMALTLFLITVMRATHAPAAATTLLIALGAFALTAKDASSLVVGVLLIAGIGWCFRVMRLRPGEL